MHRMGIVYKEKEKEKVTQITYILTIKAAAFLYEFLLLLISYLASLDYIDVYGIGTVLLSSMCLCSPGSLTGTLAHICLCFRLATNGFYEMSQGF
jgi:hypothetical protein